MNAPAPDTTPIPQREQISHLQSEAECLRVLDEAQAASVILAIPADAPTVWLAQRKALDATMHQLWGNLREAIDIPATSASCAANFNGPTHWQAHASVSLRHEERHENHFVQTVGLVLGALVSALATGGAASAQTTTPADSSHDTMGRHARQPERHAGQAVQAVHVHAGHKGMHMNMMART
jgi:hypothetical protein